MELVLVVVAGILVLFVLGLLIWLIITNFASRREIAGQASGIGLLQQQLEALKAAQDKLTENLQRSLQAGQTNISQNLQSSQQTLSRLNSQIGELQGTNKQMLQVKDEVKRLQDILSSPKLRGQMGERSLENMLSQILPRDSYELQHTFKDGKIVDALVKMTDFSVPIDAKFLLPAFEKIVSADTEEEKTALRRQFVNDVTKHIDKIAADYIRPKSSFSVSTTQARQSFLPMQIGSICSTSSNQTRKPNLQSALLCQYSSLPTIWRLYCRLRWVILSGVKFSKFFTAAAVAAAQTGPLLTFKKILSPTRTCCKKECFVLVKRDSMVLRPSRIASR